MRLFLNSDDIADSTNLIKLLYRIQPDEIYHLAAQSHVRSALTYLNTPAMSAVWAPSESSRPSANWPEKQILSGEQFRNVWQSAGRTAAGNHSVLSAQSLRSGKSLRVLGPVNYRESYGLFPCNGILFNHESPRRGETVVTRKVTRTAARIKAGLEEKVYLGNLEAKRDSGYAKEYVEAMWLMLQQEEPDDYVIATGQTHSVSELVEEAFSYAGLDWRKHLEVDQRYYRPAEVDLLIGDASKARKTLVGKQRQPSKIWCGLW